MAIRIINEKINVDFKKVPEGKIFLHDDNAYIKTSTVSDSFNAVNLENGYVEAFRGYIEVIYHNDINVEINNK